MYVQFCWHQHLQGNATQQQPEQTKSSDAAITLGHKVSDSQVTSLKTFRSQHEFSQDLLPRYKPTFSAKVFS